ncbi:MAG: hypothetical protein ACREOA_10470, partial [Candidatus Dormibacteria bacterium]
RAGPAQTGELERVRREVTSASTPRCAAHSTHLTAFNRLAWTPGADVPSIGSSAVGRHFGKYAGRVRK